MLSDDDLWNKCQTDNPITEEDLGINDYSNFVSWVKANPYKLLKDYSNIELSLWQRIILNIDNKKRR